MGDNVAEKARATNGALAALVRLARERNPASAWKRARASGVVSHALVRQETSQTPLPRGPPALPEEAAGSRSTRSMKRVRLGVREGQCACAFTCDRGSRRLAHRRVACVPALEGAALRPIQRASERAHLRAAKGRALGRRCPRRGARGCTRKVNTSGRRRALTCLSSERAARRARANLVRASCPPLSRAHVPPSRSSAKRRGVRRAQPCRSACRQEGGKEIYAFEARAPRLVRGRRASHAALLGGQSERLSPFLVRAANAKLGRGQSHARGERARCGVSIPRTKLCRTTSEGGRRRAQRSQIVKRCALAARLSRRCGRHQMRSRLSGLEREKVQSAESPSQPRPPPPPCPRSAGPPSKGSGNLHGSLMQQVRIMQVRRRTSRRLMRGSSPDDGASQKACAAASEARAPARACSASGAPPRRAFLLNVDDARGEWQVLRSERGGPGGARLDHREGERLERQGGAQRTIMSGRRRQRSAKQLAVVVADARTAFGPRSAAGASECESGVSRCSASRSAMGDGELTPRASRASSVSSQRGPRTPSARSPGCKRRIGDSALRRAACGGRVPSVRKWLARRLPPAAAASPRCEK